MTAGATPGRFGRPTLTFLVIANMVGAGVFTTSGFTLESLRSPTWVVAAWVIGGLIALAGAISYGQLVRAIPESGGEYLYLSRIAHPLLGCVAGWVSLIAGFSGAIAFAATALEGYWVPTVSRPAWLPEDTVAAGVVVAGGLLHGVHVRAGAWLQNVAVVGKLGLLGVFVVIAATRLPSGEWHGAALAGTPVTGWAALGAFASALVWISLSYSGFNAAVYVTGEARDPRRTVPRALVVGTLVVVVLYVVLNAIFVLGPPAESIAGASDIAAVTAHWLAGDWLERAVRAIIVIALFTSVSSMMMAAPRVYAKMAEDGYLPAALRFQSGKPAVAVAVQVVVSLILVYATTLRGLLAYLGLTLSLCAAMSVACLFVPTLRQGRRRRDHLAPSFYLLATLATATAVAIQTPTQVLASALTFGVGAIGYLLVRPSMPS